MAPSTVQAALALNDPEGRWASAVAAASAMTCSMIAWPRWGLGLQHLEYLLIRRLPTPDGIAAWTGSIFNASVPLPVLTHTGVLFTGDGFLQLAALCLVTAG